MTLSETTSFNDQEHADELLNELIEDGHDKDEMQEFIETHGHKDFVLYYEDYTRMVEEYDQVTVDSFLEVFDLMDVEHLQDAYNGHYRTGAEFAESFVADTGYIQTDLPYWIAIDWEETSNCNQFDAVSDLCFFLQQIAKDKAVELLIFDITVTWRWDRQDN